MKHFFDQAGGAAGALAFVLAGVTAQSSAQSTAPATTTSSTAVQGRMVNQDGENAGEAIARVDKAVQVMQQMQADPGMAAQLKRATGVFVVPEYGRGALGVGARGGAGVLLVKRGGTWKDPAFYNLGGVSIGAQAGGEGGPIAFVLNNQKALRSFMKDNNWSLNASAGLTVVNWSKKAQGSAGRGDVTVWSSAEGLFGGAAVSVTDINFDRDQTAAYYGRQVAARDVLAGKVANPQASSLRQALAEASMGSATSTMGGSGSAGTATGGTGEKR